jgi:hypothetical protein
MNIQTVTRGCQRGADGLDVMGRVRSSDLRTSDRVGGSPKRAVDHLRVHVERRIDLRVSINCADDLAPVSIPPDPVFDITQ